MRTSEQIKTEIAQKFGFFPIFFEPAQQNPQVLENLWQQTLCAYVNNPLPYLFKEKLFAYLSRYCAIPYCIICHSCGLRQFGIKAREVLELLEMPALTAIDIELKLGITVSKQYGDLPLVECYPAQLNQVFMNLLSNAIDALNESASLPNKQIVIQTQAITPNQIRVRIGDNGPGIPSEIKDHIFDPFFTTKPVGKGTGLGLSICYQVIEKHRGQISVSSHLGQGTEFVITLPVNTAVKGD